MTEKTATESAWAYSATSLKEVATTMNDIENHLVLLEKLILPIQNGEKKRLTRRERLDANSAYKWLKTQIDYLESLTAHARNISLTQAGREMTREFREERTAYDEFFSDRLRKPRS